MADINEDVVCGSIREGLGQATLINVSSALLWQNLLKNTYTGGTDTIDGIWTTTDIEVTYICWLPFEHSPGDHRVGIFKFTEASSIGIHTQRIIPPKCQQLRTKQPWVVQAYLQTVTEQFECHNISKHLGILEAEFHNQGELLPESQSTFKRLDQQITETLTHSEARCQKVYRGPLPLCAPVKLWDG